MGIRKPITLKNGAISELVDTDSLQAKVEYDNTISGLTATQHKEAIDELAANKEEGIGVPGREGLNLASQIDGTRSWDLPVKEHSDDRDYFINEVCTYQGTVYKANSTHTASVFDLLNWEPSAQQVGSGVEFAYQWSTDTSTADPTSGHIAVNNADPLLADEVQVSKTTRYGNDVTPFLETWNLGDFIGFEEETGDHEAVYYQINGSPIDTGTYIRFPVVYAGGGGNPENNRNGVLSYVLNPKNKLPLGGTEGASLVKLDDTNFNTDWQQRADAVLPVWVDGTYNPKTLAHDNGGLYISNQKILPGDARPSPETDGDEFYLYDGVSPTAATSAKLIRFGTEFDITGSKGQLNGYKIYTIAGNHYITYLVEDPATEAVITVLDDFTASNTGWQVRNVSNVIINDVVFWVIGEVNEPDPAPTTFSYLWNVTSPNNPSTPVSGEWQHANRDIAFIHVHKTDADGVADSTKPVNEKLSDLEVGDIMDSGSYRYSIQDIIDQGTYYTFAVAPATQSPTGDTTIIFETVTATPITYMQDDTYWSGSPYTGQVTGLLSIDGVEQIFPDSAFGTDVILQRITTSEKWDFLAGEQSVGPPSAGTATWGLVGGDIYSQLDLVALVDETNVPAGGTAGQTLVKTSNTDNDVEWVDAESGVTAGEAIVYAIALG